MPRLRYIVTLFAITFSPLLAQEDAAPVTETVATVETAAPNAEPVASLPPDPTKPPVDDPNFDLLGEFVGELQTESETDKETVGLQLRPLAGDRFDALLYHGGLPGQGMTTPEPISLIGWRAGKVLVLSGGPWAMFVEAQGCRIVDINGRTLGTLDRIERMSPTLGVKPPVQAMVLFDGSNTDQFTNAKMTADGLLIPGADVKPLFQDFNMHVEFMLPYMSGELDQKRGNSGCYLLTRYELQILDSFAQPPVFNGCGSLYRTKSPDVNMCLPPLVWQTYDMIFTAPRWAADGEKLRPAHLTVWHNGVKIQDDVEVKNKTGNGSEETAMLLPIRFQDHKDPVRYRNIWIIDRGLSDATPFPVNREIDAE